MAKRIITVLLALLGALLAVALVYVAYVMVTYERLPDNLALTVDAPLAADEAAPVVSADEEFTVVTANLGFGAYNRDFDFFMDGGSGVNPDDEKTVTYNMMGIECILEDTDADVILLQEVDTDSARSFGWDSSGTRNVGLGFRPVLEVLNTDPLISDSDRNLGDKNTNFTIEYTVDDADSGDVLTATESLDGRTTKSFAPTRKAKNTISINIKEVSLGQHTVKVVVTDGQGGTATRTWTFTRVNSAPVISGADTNLGDKNIGFTYTYTVDDADGDAVTVVEKLNDETLRTLNNAPKGEQLSISITSEKLYALGLNTVNNLVIEASDGQGGTSYRRLTFKRTNSAPSISGEDKDLGQQTGSFAETYTVTDVEGDNVVVTEFVDDQEIRSYQATLGEEETIELSREKWLTLTNGAHQLRVEAVDGNFATSVRVWNFSKKETVIKFQFAKPEETDARATKILITPTWKIEGSVAKVEACNNAFDAAPTWEDITAQVAINRVFNFTNETKTAEKWGVDVRFTITKNEGYEGEVSISGFGGAYE